jgi:hypothetical protein
MAATSETATTRPTVLGNFMGGSFAARGHPAIFAKQSLLAMDCRVRPGNDGCASSRHMRRYREPFPVLLRSAIGVAPVRLLSVGVV